MRILLRDQTDTRWKLLGASDYQDEAALRDLVFESPSVIPLEEIRPGAPPLLVGVREFGLPGSGSTDVLAFNGKGDIAILECKLADNDEIKRKVIGQILEYGAYLWGMSYEALNERIVRQCRKSVVDLMVEGQEQLVKSSAVSEDDGWNEVEFRQGVEESLARGNFLLIIVVDNINDELSRTIRFLNGCGNPMFSLAALEVPRFKSGSAEILVPHLYGPVPPKPTDSRPRYPWTAERFFEVAAGDLPLAIVQALRDLYSWASGSGGVPGAADAVEFGIGAKVGSFTFKYVTDTGIKASVFSVYTSGKVQLNYAWLVAQVGEEAVKAFHYSLTAIPSFKDVPADFSKWPNLPMADILSGAGDALARFEAAVVKFGRAIGARATRKN